MSEIKKINSDLLSEEYYEVNHSSGLKIFVFPKEGYKSTYALFGTKYGSIDNRFKEQSESDYTDVPEGIAHFLEHKLFENEEIDAFERYAETGASANAYTSFDRTCYLFQCSSRLEDNLRILLDFVTHPYFTKETVEKEQGIIGQEITMYYDVPGWMSMFNLLRCLYKNHPVRIDIAGTVETISHITDKLLYKCYNTFYNLNNMCLAVAGNVDVNQVVKICDEMLETSKPFEINRSFETEPRDIVKSYEECKLSVGVPVFSFGYKEECKNEKRSLKEIISMDILLEIIAGKNSKLYLDLFEKGLLNPSFSSEYFEGNGFEAVLFEGESSNPELVAEEIKKSINNLRQNGISDEIFEAARRKLYGREVMMFNDVEDVANSMLANYFSGYSIFESAEMYKTISKKDIEETLNKKLNDRYSALSVVKSKD